MSQAVADERRAGVSNVILDHLVHVICEPRYALNRAEVQASRERVLVCVLRNLLLANPSLHRIHANPRFEPDAQKPGGGDFGDSPDDQRGESM